MATKEETIKGTFKATSACYLGDGAGYKTPEDKPFAYEGAKHHCLVPVQDNGQNSSVVKE